MSEVLPPKAGMSAGREERCICNRLVCIIRDDIIEIKCNKCKRLMWIYTKGIIKTEVGNS